MGVFIGLDVSLSKTAVCVVDRDGAGDLNIKRFGDHVLSAWTTHPSDPIMGRPL